MNVFDQEIMARTAMGEARGEGQDGMIAVMWTGVNRFRTKSAWFSAMTIAGVFMKRLQYDCWVPEDVNYAYIINIADNIGLFRLALKWASGVITGMIPDPTGGATHYANLSVCNPDWVKNATQTVVIGQHTFFKNVA